MNSKFLITLKRVSYSRNAFPDAVKELEKSYNDLQRTLGKYALKNSDMLKQFVVNGLHQIKEEKRRIEGWHKTLSVKDWHELNALPYSEILEYDRDLNYYSEILTLCDSAIDDLKEYLNAYFPGIYIDNQQRVQTPDFGLILLEIRKSENLFWKGLPMDKVISHFEILTIRKNKNGNIFLTKEQFISFLKRAFLNDKTQPVQKINCSAGEKGFVIKRFYDFYELAVSQYKHTNKKETFINLFNDCFDNWKPETVKSFFKPGKTKETW